MPSAQETDRGHWDSQVQFILACLGYAVGLGNVWRFPYLCGRSGGAAFLIPYLIMMVIAGLPTFYVELAIGQFAQVTPVVLYERMAPAFAGIGACMLMSVAYTALTYNVIIAWSMHYMGNTFRSPLRWSHCTNDFNTFRCYDDILFPKCLKNNLTYYRGACLNSDDLKNWKEDIEKSWEIAASEKWGDEASGYQNNFTVLNSGKSNITEMKISEIFNLTGRKSPTQEYLYLRMLYMSEGAEPSQFGTPSWELVICLLASWILVFLCLIGGTKSSGKVVYFTATFPYVILLILLVRGLTLGAGVKDGIKFFLVPKTEQLAKAKVWGDAAMQIFFSLSLGTGGLTTIASYNKFHTNIFRDTLIVVLGNCATSIFAGFVIFPVVGFIAHELEMDVSDIADQGIGLAFQVYPHAINRMAVPQLWAFLFFFMLILLGIDSQMVLVETMVTAITDKYPRFRSKGLKMLVLAVICTAGFTIGVAFTTPGGPYWSTLIGDYGSGWSPVIACIFELVLVMWVYGYKNFIADVALMLGKAPNKFYKILGYPVNWYWIVNWVVLAPVLLTVVIIFNLVQFSGSSMGSYKFPAWADVIGLFITLSCIIFIPAMGLYNAVIYYKAGEPKSALFKPTPEWGPGDPEVREHVMLMQSANRVGDYELGAQQLRGGGFAKGNAVSDRKAYNGATVERF